MKKITLAAIGCGARTNVYFSLAMKHHSDKFVITALADPLPSRRALIAGFQKSGSIRHFSSGEEFLLQDRMADAVLIATQDNYHFAPALKALEKGYDVILEKPISNNLEEVLILDNKARELDRKVLICHVLRYTPFYTKVKEIIDEGMLGDIISINAVEGVNAWHQTHSYVRGKWADTKKSSPMILAKSCHDMDIISWLIGEKCVAVSSFGALTYFREENAPEGAPLRCTDGCPVKETCPYNALLYMTERRDPWLAVVLDRETQNLENGGASDEEILDWLKTSPWGRCVYRCDNDAVDHQVVSMKFRREITAGFTMTAFEYGRSICIYGTRGNLKGGEFHKEMTGYELTFTEHVNQEKKSWKLDFIDEGYDSHGGGDYGYVDTWYEQLSSASSENLQSSIHESVESHVMAWAAEESRISDKTISMNDYLTGMKQKAGLK